MAKKLHQPKTKYQIIDELANQHMIEHLVHCVVPNQSLSDLVQDLYYELLQKDDATIIRLYNHNELNYFIVGIIRNNLFSTSSPYYYKYKRFQHLTKNIDDLKQ